MSEPSPSKSAGQGVPPRPWGLLAVVARRVSRPVVMLISHRRRPFSVMTRRPDFSKAMLPGALPTMPMLSGMVATTTPEEGSILSRSGMVPGPLLVMPYMKPSRRL